MTDAPAPKNGPVLDRRTTLAWFAAAVSTGTLAACDGTVGSSWRELKPIDAPKIPLDPDFAESAVPWPLTMTEAQKQATTALIDVILPAEGEHPSASDVGVTAFIDEWISAPYERQGADRNLVVPGLAWLDKEAAKRGGGKTFAAAPQEVKIAIVEDIAFRDRVKPGLEKPAEFFAAMRRLTLGGYYTTPEGWADIGYMGNAAISGPYPGPTPEAMAHLQAAIAKLPPARA